MVRGIQSLKKRERDPPYHEIFAVKKRKFNYPFRANRDLAYLKHGITLA